MADLYLESCQANSVVPVSRLLRQGSASELNLQHRGLGPQVSVEGHWNHTEGRMLEIVAILFLILSQTLIAVCTTQVP